jgi:hypothetical protein
MDLKSISIVLVGVTVIYAGILSLADDLYAGIVMVIIGGISSAIPIWKAVSRQKVQSGPEKPPAKRKRKAHLKVLDGENEERPTIH